MATHNETCHSRAVTFFFDGYVLENDWQKTNVIKKTSNYFTMFNITNLLILTPGILSYKNECVKW